MRHADFSFFCVPYHTATYLYFLPVVYLSVDMTVRSLGKQRYGRSGYSRFRYRYILVASACTITNLYAQIPSSSKASVYVLSQRNNENAFGAATIPNDFFISTIHKKKSKMQKYDRH